ncbi:hypothetical protein [Eleftheria terrae]|uniref:hypothetical protein n=1 Tax=Eleftheria terrae TaxID=1597781 RepID=UPI00263B830D|nr:hypothetical protein [Eleftheria terrae]WKB52993.1 hypothetical protein N7L95_00900 [Eleftheria terrae]
MDSITADRLIRFANSHDDGTPQPRAEFDAAAGAVVVRSTEAHPDGRVAVVLDSVRSLQELRDVLGY